MNGGAGDVAEGDSLIFDAAALLVEEAFLHADKRVKFLTDDALALLD